jgi:hypothetical protein
LLSLLPITKFKGGYIFYVCEPSFLAKAKKIREMTINNRRGAETDPG